MSRDLVLLRLLRVMVHVLDETPFSLGAGHNPSLRAMAVDEL